MASQLSFTATASKKDKGASNPEASECANCLAQESDDTMLSNCSQCGMVLYCSKDCQRAHWKANHKHHCVSKADRAPASSMPTRMRPSDGDLRPLECPVCFDPLAEGNLCTLPCSHTFHAACVEGLRKFGIKQVCPMCRMELPSGPQKLEEATWWLCDLQGRLDRGEAAWGVLTKAQHREFICALTKARGLTKAQQREFGCALTKAHGLTKAQQREFGCMIFQGQGDFTEAMRKTEQSCKAAEKGDVGAKLFIKVAEEAMAAAKTALSSKKCCANCGATKMADGCPLKPCTRCKTVVYCGVACQTKHWKEGGAQSSVQGGRQLKAPTRKPSNSPNTSGSRLNVGSRQPARRSAPGRGGWAPFSPPSRTFGLWR